MPRPSQLDLTGQAFHGWTVVYDPGSDELGRWLTARLVSCVCRCGTRRGVRADRLVKGLTRSCGLRACRAQ